MTQETFICFSFLVSCPENILLESDLFRIFPLFSVVRHVLCWGIDDEGSAQQQLTSSKSKMKVQSPSEESPNLSYLG